MSFLFLLLFIETWILIPVTEIMLRCTIFPGLDIGTRVFHGAAILPGEKLCQEISMSKATVTAFAILSLFLSACTTTTAGLRYPGSGASAGNEQSYCENEDHKPVCIMGGIFLGALIGGILLSNHGGGGGGQPD